MRHPAAYLSVLAMLLAPATPAWTHPGGHGPRLTSAGPAATASPDQLAQATRRPANRVPPATAPATNDDGIAAAFAPFVARSQIQTHADGKHFFIESNGIPAHPLMVGITAWQQQVPLPQPYVGDNAWQIPLRPVPAATPRTTKNAFLRGAIAVAVNGIPIFNPLNNRGEDAFLIGELDTFGGHCGRADDYHYHIAPVHLQETVGPAQPIAYALDGYPIYGYEEPDGTPVRTLDACNGHTGPDGSYHYHATRTYPYLNGGFHGTVTERDGQVDPQPRARPIRPALTPLRGATITDFASDRTSQALLTYQIAGRTGTVAYRRGSDGSIVFTFTDPDGRQRSETYYGEPKRPEAALQNRGRKANRPSKPKKQPGQKRGEEGQGPETPAARTTDNRTESRPSPGATDLPSLTVTSPSVTKAGRLSPACTCDGAGISPAVAWQGVPPGTRALALSLWHRAPDQEKSYWVVTTIPPTMQSLPEGVRLAMAAGPGPVLGRNDRGRRTYEPPCSRGPGLKTYHLSIYALSDVPVLPAAGATRADLLDAIQSITLATGTLDLQYERTAR